MLPSPLSLFFFFKHATKCYQVAFQRQSGKVPKSASLPINSRSHQPGQSTAPKSTSTTAYLIGFDLEALTIHGYCTSPICCAGKVAYGTQWTVKRVHL